MIVAWPLLVGLGLFGWGRAAAAAARRWSGVDMRSAADLLPLGMAVYLAMAGAALALDLDTRWFATGMILTGVAVTVVTMSARVRDRSSRSFGGFAVGAGVVGLLLAIAFWRAALFRWNACDDDAAYLYLARRLTDTGDLLDPMNFRRVTSLGGMSSLQAIFLSHLGDSALPLADLFLGSLLVMVQLWRTASGSWSIWGIGGALAVILFIGNLQLVNTSPALLGVGLALAAFRLAMRISGDEARRSPTPGRFDLVLGGALGLVVAAAGTLRPQFALALVPFAIAAALLSAVDRSKLYCVMGLAAGGAAGLGGWMVASWRAVDTPVFPVMEGNVDPRWPASGPDKAGPTVVGILGDLAHILSYPQVSVAFVLGSIVLLGLRRQASDGAGHRPGRIYFAAVGATAVLLLYLGIAWWNSGALLLFPRYWMPIVMAVALFPLAVVTRSTLVGRRAISLQVGAFVAAVVTTAGVGTWRIDLGGLVSDTLSGRSLHVLQADRHVAIEKDYDEVSRMIEPGSKVLAAVDVPSLLLGHDFDVHTLDIPGSTSSRPRLPYFEGAEAKVAWARDNGYDYIVATEPAASTCLYNAERQEKGFARGGVYRAWAPWYLDWFDFIGDVTLIRSEPDAVPTSVGSLLIVKVQPRPSTA